MHKMKRNGLFLAEPSKKMLVFTSALALVACTVVLWGVVGHSGKLVRQNAELAMIISNMAPEPKWGDELVRADLEKSLIAARPELEGAQICFVAPCWAVVHTAEKSLLLKWRKDWGNFVWTSLDEATRE